MGQAQSEEMTALDDNQKLSNAWTEQNNQIEEKLDDLHQYNDIEKDQTEKSDEAEERQERRDLAYYQRKFHSRWEGRRRRLQERIHRIRDDMTYFLTRPTFFCQICLENIDQRQSFTFNGSRCEHSFCRQCLQTNLQMKINEAKIKIDCPMADGQGCRNFATEDDVQELCGEEYLKKLHRFSKLKESTNYRECPKCNHLQMGDPLQPSMICQNCGLPYCFVHANAHSPTTSCKDFEHSLEKSREKTQELIIRTSKKCPQCKSDTEKYGGCNHITCSQCGSDWCWLCGRNMSQRHYEPWNILGCPGAQFADISTVGALRLERFFTFTAFLIIGTLAFPFAVVYAVLATFVCILGSVCWEGCRKILYHEISLFIALCFSLLIVFGIAVVFAAAWSLFSVIWFVCTLFIWALFVPFCMFQHSVLSVSESFRSWTLAPILFLYNKFQSVSQQREAL